MSQSKKTEISVSRNYHQLCCGNIPMWALSFQQGKQFPEVITVYFNMENGLDFWVGWASNRAIIPREMAVFLANSRSQHESQRAINVPHDDFLMTESCTCLGEKELDAPITRGSKVVVNLIPRKSSGQEAPLERNIQGHSKMTEWLCSLLPGTTWQVDMGVVCHQSSKDVLIMRTTTPGNAEIHSFTFCMCNAWGI